MNLAKYLHFQDNSSPDNTVLLVGSGRSGTTWLSNIINYNNEFRYLFEPFRPEKIRVVKDFVHNQFLEGECQDENFLGPIDKVLSGKVYNIWTDKFNRRIISTRRLIKDIRANLFLRLIKNRYPKMKIIYLIRNPYAVISSQMKMDWDCHIKDLMSQDRLFKYLDNKTDKIVDHDMKSSRLIYKWCVENFIPLSQFTEDELLLVYYENLCTNPEREIKRIFKYINIDFSSQVMETVNTPSQLSFDKDKILTTEVRLNSWKKTLTKEQMKDASKILNKFGFDGLYDKAGLPDKKVINRMMKDE